MRWLCSVDVVPYAAPSVNSLWYVKDSVGHASFQPSSVDYVVCVQTLAYLLPILTRYMSAVMQQPPRKVKDIQVSDGGRLVGVM